MFRGGGKRRIGRAITGLVLTGATGLAGAGHSGADHDPLDAVKRLRPEASPTVTASPSHSRSHIVRPSHTAKPSPSATRTHVARPHEHQAKRSARLEINKSVTPNPMIIGEQATYTVTVTNTGDEAAQDVTMLDTIDPDLTVGTLPAGCAQSGQTVTCGGTGTTLAAGESVGYQIPVTVDSDVSDGTNITNQAQASATGGVPTAHTRIDTQTQTLTDVEITKTGPATVAPDGTITYTITVTNHGPSDAVDVTVQDETNGNLTSITGRPDQCPGDTGLTVSCSLGTLKPGESQTLTLRLKVNSDVEAGTEIPNCAKVYTGSRENNTDNNRSCTTTIVTPETPTPTPTTPSPLADLTVAKTGPATTHPDGTVTYTVKVTNDSDVDATDVTISDVDPELEDFTELPSQCSDDGAEVTCSLGTIAAHDSVTLTFTAHVHADAEGGSHIVNCATANTTSPEVRRRNNSSCVDTVVEEGTPTPTPTPTTPTPTTSPTSTPTGSGSPGPHPSGSTPSGGHPGMPGGPGGRPPGVGPALPFTGAPLALLALGALGLIGAGAVVRLRARRE